MQIAFLLFPQVTALDAIGPYEVLQRLPGAEVIFVGAERGEVRTDNGKLGLSVDATLDEVPSPEVLVVPGGMGTRPLVKDETILGWIRQVHETSLFTTSVCTGSLLLAAAGLLNGLDATTHWGAKKALEDLGAHYTEQRVVQNGKIITAAGVSSGIDMAIYTGGTAHRSGHGTGDAALHRVRPPAALRLGRRVEGNRGSVGASRGAPRRRLTPSPLR